MVNLTLQEHFNIHRLLYLYYKDINDYEAMLKMGSAFWLMCSRGEIENPIEYEEIRILHKDRMKVVMSEAMKGMIPGKYADSGKKAGHISITDSRYLDGSIIHTSKGRIQSNEERYNTSLIVSGKGNPNYSGYSDDFLISLVIKFTDKLKRIPSHPEIIEMSREENIKFPKSFSKNRFGGNKMNMFKIIEEKTGLKYNPYRRTKQMKEKISKTLKEKNDKN